MKILILVEGKWDKIFAEKVIKPLFEKKYRKPSVNIRKFAELPSTKITNIVNEFDKNGMSLWGILTDHDKHHSMSMKTKREEVKKKYSLPSIESICLVVREIEDWYSVGITREAAEKIGIPDWHKGKFLGKDFYKNHSTSEIDLRLEILKGYSKRSAMNYPSFKYFIDKFELNVQMN